MADLDLKVVSYDGHNLNDGTNYVAGVSPGMEWGLPDVEAQLVQRDGLWPILGGIVRNGREIQFVIQIVGSLRTLRDQLLRWFDPEDETPKAFVVEDEDGTHDRYVNALCRQCLPQSVGEMASHDTFQITLVIDGDVRWRSTSEDSDSWSITASGQTHVVANGGSDDAYPSFEITPTSNKAGGLAYKQFVPVTWRSNNPGWSYPVRLGALDTSTLVGASKVQADGDDLRVYVDGVEVDRWLVSMNSANTYLWVNLDFAPQCSATLQAAIASTGAVSTIGVGEDVYDFPESGLVLIDDELFTYTGRDLADEELTGVTRAAKGSSMAAHTTSDTVYWIQHEILIAYGNGSLTAPSTDDDYEPAFALSSSSNSTWAYTVFGDPNDKRTARWQRWGNITLAGAGGVYTATQRVLINSDYSVMGAWLDELHGNAYGWYLNNPCGIVNAAWADGYKRAEVVTDFLVHLRYWERGANWWTNQATLSDPSTANTWEAWSQAAAGSDWDAADTLCIALYFFAADVEVGTVTVSLNASETPQVSMSACAEQGNYALSCTITNTDTGEWITLDFDMELTETLTVDTDDETITYDADGSSQFQAIDWSSTRAHWLRLLPGNNTLQFDDTGTAGVTFVTKFEERSY